MNPTDEQCEGQLKKPRKPFPWQTFALINRMLALFLNVHERVKHIWTRLCQQQQV